MASMFQGLLKTPEQIRQEEQKALQERGLTAAAMLTRGSGGASSGLPGLLQGFGANIAQNIDQGASNLVKRGLGGLGGIAGALGQQQAQQTLQQASMSPEERRAVQGQGIAKAMQSGDPESLREAARQFRAAGLAQAAEAAETRAVALEAAKAKAEAEAKRLALEERRVGVSEEQLGVTKKRLKLDERTEKRIADAEAKGYTLMDADSMLTAGFPQDLIDNGLVVTRGPKGSMDIVFQPTKEDSAKITNVKTVVNSETKKATQIGVLGNKMVEITAEGTRPVDFDYTKPVELTGNAAEDKIKIATEARSELGPLKKNIMSTDQALLMAQDAKVNQNPSSEAQLDRMMAKITGDSNLGVTEIKMISSGGSAPSKIANYLSKVGTGVSTDAKLEEKIETINLLRDYLTNDLNERLKTFDNNYGEFGVDIDQYRLSGSKSAAKPGLSSEAQQLAKELGIGG